MSNYTPRDIIDIASEKTGLPITEIIKILNIPLHPRELRDEFAMSALPSILTKYIRLDLEALENIGYLSYMVADEMLEARLKGKQ